MVRVSSITTGEPVGAVVGAGGVAGAAAGIWDAEDNAPAEGLKPGAVAFCGAAKTVVDKTMTRTQPSNPKSGRTSATSPTEHPLPLFLDKSFNLDLPFNLGAVAP